MNNNFNKLDEFIVEGNEKRNIVIEYLKNSKFKLENLKLKECFDYTEGISLIDAKERRIVVYYNEKYAKAVVMYADLNKTEVEVDVMIKDLWYNYCCDAEEINQDARIGRMNNGNIYYERYSIEDNNRVHISMDFDEENEKYNIIEYLQEEIKNMERIRDENE